jgi:molybdopterin synthase sulfur carrier subunit
MIKVLFFAQLADFAETDAVELNCPAEATVRHLLTELENSLPKKLIENLRHGSNMISINQVLADWDDSLTAGDEVAFLPPFSGG